MKEKDLNFEIKPDDGKKMFKPISRRQNVFTEEHIARLLRNSGYLKRANLRKK